jgi:hypothetical protein
MPPSPGATTLDAASPSTATRCFWGSFDQASMPVGLLTRLSDAATLWEIAKPLFE